MNSILFFDPARERWDTRRPDSLRNRIDPPSSISILTVTWTAPPSGGSGSTTTTESEAQALRVDRIIREHNTPTIIALAGVPRAFIQQLLNQQSVRQGYAFSQLEGDSSSCALLWRISFAVFFVEPKARGFPCMLAHSRELFGAPAVISTAAFPYTNVAGSLQVSGGTPEQLRELWESYLGSVGSDTTAIAVCFVGSAVNTAGVANLRSNLRPAPVDAVSDGPHAIWYRAADGRQISAQVGVPPLQNLSDRITQVTLATLAGGLSPAPSNSQTPVPSSIISSANNNNNNNANPMMNRNTSGNTSGLLLGNNANNSNNTPNSLLNNNNNNSPASISNQGVNTINNSMTRQWLIKNNCNIKARENTVEILYDLSPCFSRIEDCIRTLNHPEFRWNSDFAICHGRLFASSGARSDLGSFQRWMREHDPPITHSQRSELIANKPKLLMLANSSPAAANGGGGGASTTGTGTPTLISNITNNNNMNGGISGTSPTTSPVTTMQNNNNNNMMNNSVFGNNNNNIINNNNNNGPLSPPNPNSMQQQQQTAAQHLFGNSSQQQNPYSPQQQQQAITSTLQQQQNNNTNGMLGSNTSSSTLAMLNNNNNNNSSTTTTTMMMMNNNNNNNILSLPNNMPPPPPPSTTSTTTTTTTTTNATNANNNMLNNINNNSTNANTTTVGSGGVGGVGGVGGGVGGGAGGAAAAARFYRRGWTTNRAVLLHQIGPVELQAFDVTAELGVVPRPLPALVDRLNGGVSQQYAQIHLDPLASYSKDYALCYCAERRGYWLVAAPNVPCDPLIARAVALQLKKQRMALMQQQQQQQQQQHNGMLIA